MPTRLKHQDATTPFWMLTMGDMNMLLLTFFITLISFLLLDKAKYLKLQEEVRRMGSPGRAAEKGAVPAPVGENAGLGLKTLLEQPAAETRVYRAKGHYTLLQRLQEGTLLTIGGEEGSFAEGRWDLTPRQIEMLVELKKWMVGRSNVIEVRGHASANFQDSVVLEPDGRIRPFAPADLERPGKAELANHSLLSWLRANEVRKFLLAEHPALGDTVKIDELRVRIRADSYTRNVADSLNPVENVKNRRIEVLATSELGGK